MTSDPASESTVSATAAAGREVAAPEGAAPRPGSELAWGALLLALGLLPRVLMAVAFPVRPISDFSGVLSFATAMRDQSIAAPGYYWDVFNVGPPLVVSVLLRLFPHDPEATARLATAVWTGLMPLLPFLIWRRVMPLWVRVLAGALLALWPGQVLFSGVLAQDNWVTPPTVAVGALAARAIAARRSYPVAAGLLFALAVVMRQEMMYVLLLALLAGAGIVGVPGTVGEKAKRAALCALAVAVPFLAMAWQRQAATGHFALSSGHVGYTLLGTVRPGATHLGWDDPVSYVATLKPELVRDRQRLFHETLPLALAEVRRRPVFQTARVVAAALRTPFNSDADDLYWSLGAEGVQPAEKRAAAADLSARAGPWLLRQARAIHALFLAALLLGLWKRDGAVIVVALTVLAKVVLHAVLVSTGRFLVPATALELIAIALGCWLLARTRAWRAGAVVAAIGIVVAIAAPPAARALTAKVQERDPTDVQRTYRFTLTGRGHAGALDCVVSQGKLVALDAEFAVLEPLHEQAPAGEVAAADCALRDGAAAGEPLALAFDAGGGPPAGSVRQRVAFDGREVLSRDAGAPAGPARAELGRVACCARRPLRVELVVERPIAARAASTTFRLVRGGAH